MKELEKISKIRDKIAKGEPLFASEASVLVDYIDNNEAKTFSISGLVSPESELPPVNTPVLVVRSYNGKKSTYIAMRNINPLSTDTDPSRNCHWHGVPIDELRDTQVSIYNIKMSHSFSDITVQGWSFIKK